MRKRILTVTAVVILLITLLSAQNVVFGMEFSDVPITATYYKAVDMLSNDGVIQGRGNGIFGPTDKTTRAEFCAFVARAKNYNEAYYSSVSNPFNDLDKAAWANGYISFCYDNGYVNGMDAKSFAPCDNVTCEQAIKIVVCASGIGDESLSKVGPNWYSGYLNVAKKNKLLKDCDYEISKPASRALVAQLVYNSLLISDEGKAVGKDAVDVSGNRLSSGVNVEPKGTTVAAVYEPEEIWEPSDDWNYYQYYGEDYQQYIDEEKSSEAYTIPDDGYVEEYEYVPRGSSDGMLIVLDPGHNYSGVDTGAVGNGLREQDVTYKIASKVKPLLENNGFTVIMTRNALKENVSNESVSASLSRRSEIANRNSADLFLSIHCNAGGGTGTETYYCTGSQSGKVFASYIQQAVLEEVGLRNRGVKNAKYAVLKNTNMPAALLETAFIDTESDASYLGSDEYQQAFAEGIAKGICEYVGIDYMD